MARKKQEVQLMQELDSQEEWEEVMAKEGLWVIDVFQEWCGPCEAMVGNFRRIKNELGDDLLHFAMAKADNIDILEKYRGSCEPCFLFYAGGLLVAYIHGANAPLILRTLTEQLAYEHKVLDGSAERKEVKDLYIAAKEAEAPLEEDESEEEEGGYVRHRRISALPSDYETVEEGYTVAIIKPNAVADGKVDEIVAEMKAKGIKVLAQEERQLTEEEAREFYSHLAEEDYYDDLCKFMASGPSFALVLTKGSEDDAIIKDWRDMLGPAVVEVAKEEAPDSLRAKYGDGGFMNALHGSDSKETAARELAFFFPDMHTPTITRKHKDVQRTLALIRPDAFAKSRDEILERIKESGFQIALHKVVQLTKEQAQEFYSEHAGQPYFEELVECMSCGPLLALGLARDDAIESWRSMLGPPDLEEAKETAPDSLRAQFAVEDVPLNQLHGSDSPETAKKELEFFFPMQQTVAMIKPDAFGTKDTIVDKIHAAGFRIAARKETTITRDIAESFYEDQKEQPYFNDLVDHMCSGPTMFMVLSREDAVEGWRQVIGPTDPEKAKEEAPDTLRAQFGTDVLKNAVHGASTKEAASEKIEQIFGHLEFNADGTVKVDEQPGQDAEEQEEQRVAERQQEEQPEAQQEQAEQPAEQAEQPAEQQEQPAEQQEQAKQQPEQGGKGKALRSKDPKEARKSTDSHGSEAPPTKGEAAEEAKKEEAPAEAPAEQAPAEEETKPAEEEAKPEEEEAKPADEEARPAEKEGKPAEEAKPAEEEAKPAVEEAKPAEEEAKPAEEEAKPAEEEAKPAEEEAKPADEEAKPAVEEAKPADEEAKPADEEAKPEAGEEKKEEANDAEKKEDDTANEGDGSKAGDAAKA